MTKVLIFVIVTVCLAFLSRRTFRYPNSHGFYRFFAAESILALIVVNASAWFREPFAPRQLVSWLLLFGSAVLAVHGFALLHRLGKPSGTKSGDADFSFEKTTTLIRSGAYKYIRHPLYASLLLLTWGAFLKNVKFIVLLLAACATAFLVATALAEEKENLARFGEEYAEYMKTTKRFVPFVM
ncbi:MAG: isoprenylcysteine carboxylmethyltransferase family protein [candidate division KSB1 bacterium]|nr:isoprenylcysteine carboxylmethyltransferase family protein [candidate division KSB1 bacterium]MDZ7302722.1 isoprenylcysteine carboxylmethyltransferase family protein [candidate division KSB1 bacterium]MDZ7311747.1 isoprenylcysteine carboxylmethyltransferase family protein [candidate division KSB1 bacterium]